VQCQFDELKEQDTPCDIRSALSSLPTGLQETYRRILDRIRAQNTEKRWERTTKLLTWLVCQRRPLSMSELAMALAIRPGDMFADEEQKVFSENRLIQLCSPLVKLKHGTRVLEFRHFSVKEFLTTRRFEDGTDNPYYINEKDGDAELLRTCLTYLSFSQFRSMIGPIFKAHIDDPRQGLGCLEDCMAPYPFFGYASSHWHSHGIETEADPVCCRLIVSFFDNSSNASYIAWSQHRQITVAESRSYKHRGLAARVDNPSGLYYAISFGFPTVVGALLKPLGTYHNQRRECSDALLAATFKTEPRMMQMLLDNGADVSIRDRWRMTPLLIATTKKDTEVLKILLQAQAKTAIQDDQGWTPVHIASSKGNTQVLKLLLESGANVGIKDNEGETPLHLASHADRRRIEEVQMLLEVGADTKIQDSRGRTPLHRATFSANMNPQTVRMLIEAGSDLSCQDDVGQTALHYASRFKIPEIVKMLLVAGADANARDNNGKIALHHALGPILSLAENEKQHAQTILQPHTFWKLRGRREQLSSRKRKRRMFEVVESLLDAKSTLMVQDVRGTGLLEYSLSSIPLAGLFAHALTVNVSGIHWRSSSCSNGRDRSATLASYCEALLNLYPANPLIHFSLGYRYFQLNQMVKAISSFDRYVALTPANRSASRIEDVVHHDRIPCSACTSEVRGYLHLSIDRVHRGWKAMLCGKCFEIESSLLLKYDQEILRIPSQTLVNVR
jgi:ankyrin repeat protein